MKQFKATSFFIFLKHNIMIKRIFFITILLLIFIVPFVGFSQNTLLGKIIDKESKTPLQNVSIQILTTRLGGVSQADGSFIIKNIPDGKYDIEIRLLGYNIFKEIIDFKDTKTINLEVKLSKSIVDIDEIVVTATRVEQSAHKIPNKIHTIKTDRIESMPVNAIDETFRLVSGVNVDRPFGIFSAKSVVSMRGLSGNEQGRTLVMIDGIPVNKSDGGTVNFHLMNTNDVERIEVLKGPASALYGGNAMGGVINIISAKPLKPIESEINLGYGTFNTLLGGINLKGISKPNTIRYYWRLGGRYAQSDGYITEPKHLRTEYTEKSYLNEINIQATLGLLIKEKHTIEIKSQLFDDERGAGEQVIEKLGSYSEHDTYHYHFNYFANFKRIKLRYNLYFLQENYRKLNEYMKSDEYTLYDVDSRRRDIGTMLYITTLIGKHEITSGIDARQGSVVAADVYYSSSDKIKNQGFMNLGALYVQDAFDAFKKVRIIGGLRFDYAQFYDGAFTVENPSAKVEYMKYYEDANIAEHEWNSLTGKIAAQYLFNDRMKIYVSYGQGFRAPILDDMCRSGKTRGGFQAANPNLKPERLDNIELGFDFAKNNKFFIKPALYYSLGHDFMYFVSNGDTVDMGYPAAVLHSENVSEVEIYGAEIDFELILQKNITINANYAYSHSKILEYKPSTPQMSNISGKYLVAIPQNLAYLSTTWRNKIANLNISARYVGESWVNDTNTPDEKYGIAAKYDDYFSVDTKIYKNLWKHLTISAEAQNLFDEIYTDSKGQLSPGRFLMIKAKLAF